MITSTWNSDPVEAERDVTSKQTNVNNPFTLPLGWRGKMGAMGDTRGYLELSSDPVRFEPVSKVTNVFFDDTSKEVSGGGGRG